MRKNTFFVLATAAALLVTLIASPVGAAKPASVDVQILALNDFHGALDPSLVKPKSTDNTTWYYNGGAEYLANYVNTLEAANPNTIKVSAGDLFGASPLLSALFHDEPTVMAFNLMGFDYAAAGNHEFDEGWHELLRMQNGGCHPVDGCFPGVPTFTGATFEYLTANVIRLDNGETLFPATAVKDIDGVKVGFIGVSLEATPTIVVPSGVEGLQFQAEVSTINHYAKLLKEQGVKAIVVLLHDSASTSTSDPNGCNPSDPFFSNVVMKIDPEVDALITGHAHTAYVCSVTVKQNYGPMIVTSAGSNGKYLTDINLTVAGTDDQVTAATASNVWVKTPYLTASPDAAMKALLDQYRTASAPLANKIVGSITADIKRGGNMQESALGDVIGDAQLAATIDPADGGAVVAMTNPGGIRADLLCSVTCSVSSPANVTYAQAFAVQPFSNSLVTLTLTGAQIKEVLEEQATAGSDLSGRMLQVSASLTYTWTNSAPLGSKVTELKINGTPVDPTASYRVTVNNFLAAGGDNFPGFKAGTDALTGMIDLDAFVAYLEAHSPVSPGPMNRITILP